VARKAEIHKKQVFSVTEPGAERVLLAGDFTNWQQGAIPMHKRSDGVWTATVKLPPGTHSCLFTVDGKWCEDPECTVRVPNPYGGLNMERRVT
jgi:1,4-alpha-glucan branching enzyme